MDLIEMKKMRDWEWTQIHIKDEDLEETGLSVEEADQMVGYLK